MLDYKGVDISWTANAQEAESLLLSYSPDLILLDLDMPQLDGFTFLSDRQHSLPVILLSAIDSEDRRIQGFEQGADDFVAKPFSIRELAVRIFALKRRIDRVKAGDNGVLPHYPVGKIDFNDENRSVYINQSEVVLTRTEFNIFKYLFDRRGQVVSKTELQQNILKKDFGQFDRNLDMHVSNTRKKLARMSISKSLINTIRGKGYSFSH
ncbi:response regulator transcription factor [Shewanella sp. AS1]|uniref:response regulator transcription factor n=1 Tax=Shewanella sp. AS1 TaxID=2907626 RepID=UPI001F38564D|nr:response regulator transcription factor [Shewanella sp. AS1]